jgi:Fe2+ transport system protein FeoA
LPQAEETTLEKRLSELKPGERGVIVSIRALTNHGRHRQRHPHSHSWGFQKRLEDMGLTPGTRIMVVKSAPFHGPIEIYVRGSRLAIGRGMAERILASVEK